jgi:Flp pilus assembly protein TadD
MLYLFQRVFVVVFMLAAAAYSQSENNRVGITLNNEGVAQFQKGEYSEALKSLNRSAELFPTNPIVHRNLSRVYRELKDLDRAETEIINAIRLSANHAVSYNQLGVIRLEAGRYNEALEAFFKADALEPGDATILLNVGNTYIHLKDYAKATSFLERAKSANPQNETIRISLGFAYAMRKKFDLALAEARSAAQIAPKDEAAQFLLGYIYVAKDDKDAAIAQQRTVSALNPDLARRLFQAMHSDKILVVPPAGLDRRSSEP